jgi:hypothetical protein
MQKLEYHMKVELENKFSELSRRVKVTSKARYNASRRLSLQNMMSQWTLALLSVALILISLMSASEINILYSQSYVDIMQIVFAVLILAYSLLLGTGDHSARSVKVHRCGMELGRIARKIKPYENSDEDHDVYEILYNEYYNCLEKYENHEDVDYLIAQYESKDWYKLKNDKQLKDYQKKLFIILVLFQQAVEKLRILMFSLLPISHYIISIFGVYYWLFLMVSKTA